MALSRVALYLLAWGLSSIPILAGSWSSSGDFEAALGDGSRAAIAWIPWIALIGLPASSSDRRDWPLALGMALPLMVVAAWIDLQAGLGRGRIEATFAAGLLTLVTLGEARFRAARAGLVGYGPLWFSMVGVIPALAVSIAWGQGGRLTDSVWANNLAGISPISAMWRDVRPVEGALFRDAWNSAFFCPSTLACVIFLMVVVTLGRRGGGA